MAKRSSSSIEKPAKVATKKTAKKKASKKPAARKASKKKALSKVVGKATKASTSRNAASTPRAKAAGRPARKRTVQAENKTVPTGASVASFVATVDAGRRQDVETLVRIMTEVTGSEGRMWGPSIVGFGRYHYRYESGREGDFFLAGFSPRKDALTLYIMGGFPRHAALMAQLGKYRTGKSCLYVKRLADVDLQVLESLVRESVDHMRATHDCD